VGRRFPEIHALADVRLGILGGSFDPPHSGHLLAAVDAFEALSLDQLAFIPAGIQPLKLDRTLASAVHRLAMVRGLVGADSRFVVDSIEAERQGVSFSVDTVLAYAERYPSAELFFLVGTDVIASFPSWRDPGRIAELAEIVVLRRGDELSDSSLAGGSVPIRQLRTRRIDITSTEIRARVRARQSIHGFVPPAVADYIEANGLYR
jgi:nicotinate-nucleotide adenylyltransferase